MDIDPIDPDVSMTDAPGTQEASGTQGDDAPEDPTSADPAPAPVPGAASGPKSPLTVPELQARGDTAIENLNNAIIQNTPDQNAANFKNVYKVSDVKAMRAAPDLGPILRDAALPGGSKNPRSGTYTEYTVINKVGGDPRDPILDLEVSGDQGTMINEVSYANKDNLPQGQRIHWSDQAFQAWNLEEGNPRLDLVIQRNIRNDDTNNAIQQFHTASKLRNNQPGVWLPGSAQYKALMGTDNGRPVARMLQDHHQAFGNKRVTKITTYATGGSRTKSLMSLQIG